MRYESGTKYIFLILQMLVKCCFLETILRYCGSGVELHPLPRQAQYKLAAQEPSFGSPVRTPTLWYYTRAIISRVLFQGTRQGWYA